MGFGTFLRQLMCLPSASRSHVSEKEQHRERREKRGGSSRPPREFASSSVSAPDSTLRRRVVQPTASTEHLIPAPLALPARTRRQAPVLCTSGMDVSTIAELMMLIGRVFHHVPYAVCGLSAMVHYGFRARQPTRLSIICPAFSGDIMTGWALAKGMVRLPEKHNFGVLLKDGTMRRVRFKFLDSGFSSLQFITVHDVKILSLPTVADQVALAYIKGLTTAMRRTHHAFADDMTWCLRSLIRSQVGECYFTPVSVQFISKKKFWLPFTLSFPGMIELFAEAGVQILPDREGEDFCPVIHCRLGPPRRMAAAMARAAAENDRAGRDARPGPPHGGVTSGNRTRLPLPSSSGRGSSARSHVSHGTRRG